MITSGGGFSNQFPMPEYQREAVESFFRNANTTETAGSLPPKEYFNMTGRGYPDLAAIGQNVPVVFDSELQMTGGTSASTPIVAGLISLINSRRLKRNKPVMGFLNPWLYQTHAAMPEIVVDVKYGNNSGGNRLLPTYTACTHGFNAIPGWDAATGLGSPNFASMLLQAETPTVFVPPPPPRDNISWETVLVALGTSVLGATLVVYIQLHQGHGKGDPAPSLDSLGGGVSTINYEPLVTTTGKQRDNTFTSLASEVSAHSAQPEQPYTRMHQGDAA